MVNANPHAERIRGPHGISLLSHAKMGCDAAHPVFDFLQSLGDADTDTTAPLSDSDIIALTGTYVFGLSANQRIEVTVERREGVSSMYSPLTWTRKGTMGRPLVHVGDRAFYPAGAPSVRIQFAVEGTSVTMTVRDSEVVLVAQRE
jgi:hypothetical protein